MSERRGLVGKDLKKAPVGAQKPSAGKPIMGQGPQAAMVSKTGGPAAGGKALNNKAGGSRSVLSYDDVAQSLKVDEDRVHDWVRKGLLKGNAQGIQPYELEKFKTTQLGEIKRAQADLAAPAKATGKGTAKKAEKPPEKPTKSAKAPPKKVEKLPTKSADSSESDRQNKALDFIRNCLISIQESVKGAFAGKKKEPESSPPKLQVVEGGKKGRETSSGRSKRKGDSGKLPTAQELLRPQETESHPGERANVEDSPAAPTPPAWGQPAQPSWGPSNTLPVEEAMAEQAFAQAPVAPVSHDGWGDPPGPSNPWGSQETYAQTMSVEQAMAEQAMGAQAPVAPVSHGGWGDTPPTTSAAAWGATGASSPWGQETYSSTVPVEQALAEQAMGQPVPAVPVAHGGWDSPPPGAGAAWGDQANPWGDASPTAQHSWDQPPAQQSWDQPPAQHSWDQPPAQQSWDQPPAQQSPWEQVPAAPTQPVSPWEAAPAQQAPSTWEAAPAEPAASPWESAPASPWEAAAPAQPPASPWEAAPAQPPLAASSWDQHPEPSAWEQPAPQQLASPWEQPAEPATASPWEQPAAQQPLASPWEQPAEPAAASAWEQPAAQPLSSPWEQPSEQGAAPSAWEEPTPAASPWDQPGEPAAVAPSWEQPLASPWEQPAEPAPVVASAWEPAPAPAEAAWELQQPSSSPWEQPAEQPAPAEQGWEEAAESSAEKSLSSPWEAPAPEPEAAGSVEQAPAHSWDDAAQSSPTPWAEPGDSANREEAAAVNADDWLTEPPAQPAASTWVETAPALESRPSVFEPAQPERLPGPSLPPPLGPDAQSTPQTKPTEGFKLSPRFELKSRLGPPDSGERRIRREPLLKSPLLGSPSQPHEPVAPPPVHDTPPGTLPPVAPEVTAADPALEAEVARLKAQLQAQESKTEQLEVQLARAVSLHQERGEHLRNVAARDERLRQLEEELARALSVAEERSRSVSALELEREGLRRENQQLGQSAEQLQQHVAALEQQLQHNNLELTYAATEIGRLSRAEGDSHELAEKARLLESELNDARRDLSVARTRITAIQTEMVGKEQRYLKLEQEFEELSNRAGRPDSSGERQLAELQSAVSQRDHRLQELESQFAAQRQRWEAELQKAGAWVAQMNEAVAARDKKIAELESKVAAAAGRPGIDPSSTAELMAARVELSSLRRNAEVARLNALKLETEVTEAKAALQRGQAVIAGLEHQVKDIQQQREQLENRLSEGRVVLEELRAENGSLRSQLNEAVRRLELAQRAFSNAPAGGDPAELSRLQAHVKQLESEVVAIMVRLSSSEKDRIELEQRLREVGG